MRTAPTTRSSACPSTTHAGMSTATSRTSRSSCATRSSTSSPSTRTSTRTGTPRRRAGRGARRRGGRSSSPRSATARGPAAEAMYHVELRQFPHVARVFNLNREELESRFVRPYVGGTIIEHEDRRWAPERSRLKILEGRELRPDEVGMGRGWASATKHGADVTETVLAQARRGAEARPEVEALKDAI